MNKNKQVNIAYLKQQQYLEKIIIDKVKYYDFLTNLTYFEKNNNILWYKIDFIQDKIFVFLKNENIILFDEFWNNLNGMETLITMVENYIINNWKEKK